MKRRTRENLNKTFFSSAGWLFADLMLALGMLFLIATTVPSPATNKTDLPATAKASTEVAKVLATATANVVATQTAIAAPTPTPTPLLTPTPHPGLDRTWQEFAVTIDPTKLLNKDPDEKNNIMAQMTQNDKDNRSVGLVIAYGGAPTVNDISTAQEIATAIYNILPDLGKQDARFARAVTYYPLYFLGNDPTEVNIHIFLFTQ